MAVFDPHLLDIETVTTFVEMGNDIISGLVELYVANSTKEIQSLSQNAAAGQMDEIKKTAHSLKGASLNTGARAMGMLCLQIEKTIQNNDLEAARILITLLPELLEKTRLAFLQTYQ